MSVSIRIPDATFTNKIAQLYPVAENAKLINFFGGDQESSLNNLVLGSTNNPSVVGSPTYAVNYITVGNETKYINTGFTPGGEVTFIAVVQDPPESSNLMGTYADALNGDYIGTSSGLYRFDVDGNAGSLSGDRTGWKFIAGSLGADFQRLYVYQDGAQTSQNYDRILANVADRVLRIGGRNINQDFNVAAAMYYDKGLSAEEIEQVYKYLKSTLAERGITLN